MITVRITSGPIQDHLAIAGVNVDEATMKIDGKKPGEVFDAMIALEMDWEVVLDDATDEEWREWALADVVCRQVRAKKMGKVLILCGEPVNYDDFQKELLAFIAKHKMLPTVHADNSTALILGLPPVD